jgi:hypothetical protein
MPGLYFDVICRRRPETACRDVPGAGDERPILDPLQHHHGDAQARHLETADQVSFGEIGAAGGVVLLIAGVRHA